MLMQLFGGSDKQKRRPAGPFPAAGHPAPNEAAAILEQALRQVESMPRDFAELKRSMGEVFGELEGALARLGVEARRLSEESSRLAMVVGRLDERLGELPAGSLARRDDAAPPVRREEPVAAAPPEEPPARQEEQRDTFHPGNGDLRIVLSAVPGFQGLMEVQRALSGPGLQETDNASVVGFKNGEASLEVHLRSPLTAQRIVDELHRATGHELLVEEVRPDTLRLRLRFVNGEGRG